MQFRSTKCVKMTRKIAKYICDDYENPRFVPFDEIDTTFRSFFKAVHASDRVTYFHARTSKTSTDEYSMYSDQVWSFLADAKIESPRRDPTKLDRFPFFQKFGMLHSFYTYDPSAPHVSGLIYTGGPYDVQKVGEYIGKKFETLQQYPVVEGKHSIEDPSRSMIVTGSETEMAIFMLSNG